jgi:hypothetical protein
MAHFRYFETTSAFQQEIYSLASNYSFNKKVNFTLAYSYVSTDIAYNLLSINMYESRIYEDLNVKSNWRKLKLKHRFIHIDKNDETQHWFRYDINASYPLTKNWSVCAFNKIFLNFESKIFAQNFTAAGFIHKLNKNLKLKLGYFYIKLPNSDFDRLQLGIILNTDFTKKTI